MEKFVVEKTRPREATQPLHLVTKEQIKEEQEDIEVVIVKTI